LLKRQKAILDLLQAVGRPLDRTAFVKLVFLLRQETVLRRDPGFYDFVPYRFGPFSFTLYRDLRALRQQGFVSPDEDRIELCSQTRDLTEMETGVLSNSVRGAVSDVVKHYGQLNTRSLLRSVYTRYPWFALKSELPERNLATVQRPDNAPPAAYTIGYEGRSVDAFFNGLLERGITGIIDVRANSVSRKYGFAGRRLGEFCKQLELQYNHRPALGISSAERADLAGFDSYQRLLDRYEETMLPERSADIAEVGDLMQRQASVLLCVEKDVRCCHRSRLAQAVSEAADLEVIHL